MDLMILNKDLDLISIVDAYESFIWTNRYYAYGDFELYTAVNANILANVRKDYYLQKRGSDRAMIIEELEINSDVEVGNHVTASGRSLESILDRRVIWGQKTYSGNFQNSIKTMLEECIISPEKEERKISNFVFKESTDPAITELTIEAQFTGDNLYDVISTLCKEKSVGFKVTLSENKEFVFELYAGTDRSYDQTSVPYVTFSTNFDNLINSNFIESNMNYKNVTLVGGEGEGAARRYLAVGNTSGLERRETFTDARDISSDVGNEETLSDEEYNAQLQQRGNETLDEYKEVTSFEGQIETAIMYKYGQDFFDGDIVQIEDEYGHNAKVRILEIVTSDDDQGTSVYPTFETINEEGV